jgi:hypothetical protein
MAVSSTDLLTLLAILIGPIAAVIVTRWLDNRRDRRDRRMDVFRTLMRTRRMPTDPEHVGALNLVEIEFANDTNVLKWWRELMAHLGRAHPRLDAETIYPDDTVQMVFRKNRSFNLRLGDERERSRAKLLHAIANSLGHHAQQLDIFEGGYSPQGWAEIENDQAIARHFIADLAVGRKSLPVTVISPLQAGPESANETTE